MTSACLLPIHFPASTNLWNDLARAMLALDGKKVPVWPDFSIGNVFCCVLVFCFLVVFGLLVFFVFGWFSVLWVLEALGLLPGLCTGPQSLSYVAR